MQFTKKRIPRDQILAGMASVDRDGSYHPSPNRKHSYTSMVIIQGLMIAEIGQDVARALTIALKYTAFRRQFNVENGLETRVISYASVKNRLYPALCRVVPMMFFGRDVKRQIDNLKESDPEHTHLQTVAGKIWVTEHGARDVEVARMTCGGQGNMAQAGLGSMYAQLSPSRTYEGDTYVLSQQIGKVIMKHWNRRSETSVPAISYVHRLRNAKHFSLPLKVLGPSGWFTWSNQEDLLEQRASLLANRHIESTIRGDDTSYDVQQLAMAHADLTFWRSLQTMVKGAPREHQATTEALANVFSLTTMLDGVEAFVGIEYLSTHDLASLRTAHRAAIDNFSKHVPKLIDALGFTETELNSVFAREADNPYEALWETAQQSDLSDNQNIRPALLHARSLWKKYQGGEDRTKL